MKLYKKTKREARYKAEEIIRFENYRPQSVNENNVAKMWSDAFKGWKDDYDEELAGLMLEEAKHHYHYLNEV